MFLLLLEETAVAKLKFNNSDWDPESYGLGMSYLSCVYIWHKKQQVLFLALTKLLLSLHLVKDLHILKSQKTCKVIVGLLQADFSPERCTHLIC